MAVMRILSEKTGINQFNENGGKPLKQVFRSTRLGVLTGAMLERPLRLLFKQIPIFPLKIPYKSLNSMNIIEEICAFSGTSIDEIKTGKKTDRIRMCRQVLASFLYTTGKYSQEEVGEMLAIDHATVHNAIKKVRIALENERYDPIFNSYLKKLQETFPSIQISVPANQKKAAEIKKDRQKLLFELGLLHWQQVTGTNTEQEQQNVINQLHDNFQLTGSVHQIAI